MKLTPETAEAVTRLRANTDFQSFIKAVGDHGETLVQQLIYAQEDRQASVLQGKAQLVTEILKAVDTAPDRARKQ